MATVAPLRSSSANSQQARGKVPSFAAEAGLFLNEDDINSDCALSTMVKDSRNNHKLKDVIGDTVCGNVKEKSPPNASDFSDTPSLAASAISLQEEVYDEEDVALQAPFGALEQKDSDISDRDNDWRSDKSQAIATNPSYSSNMLGFNAKATTPTDYGMNTPISGSGNNTPTAESVANTPISSDLQPGGGSMSSTNSSAPRSSIRPVLYSAIGSLENINSASMGSLNKRLLTTTGRGFCPMGKGAQNSTLIPPQNQLQPQTRNNLSSTATTSAVVHGVESQTREGNFRSDPNNTRSQSQGVGALIAQKDNTSGELSDVVDRKKQSDTKQIDSSVNPQRTSNLRASTRSSADDRSRNIRTSNDTRKVTYTEDTIRRKRQPKQPIEMFRPSCDAYTPRMEKKKIQYKPAEKRNPVQQMASPMGTLQRPNFRDALRRVAMIIRQHIVKIERRFEGNREIAGKGLFRASMRDTFNEDEYCTPSYKCSIIRIPMARPGMVYGLRKIRTEHTIPSEEQIYEFAHQLFNSVQLSSECSIVCLIYVERLMEVAKVPLLACTWRPIFMCGLLLASKVWQDLSSWNIEFATVYPQFSLDAINRLELNFLRMVKWDLYISSSLYAKYYFALRSLVEKSDFRQRYNRMVGGVDSVAQSEALKIQKRTEMVKEEALLQLSRSME